MANYVGNESFDHLLTNRVGLRVEHYPVKGHPCDQCKKLETPLYNMPGTGSALCISCFSQLISRFAALLVLQVTGGK